MWVVVDRCTCCGRALNDEEISAGRFREVGFETLCERCFFVVCVSPSSLTEACSRSKRGKGCMGRMFRRLGRAFVRLGSAALKVGVIAALALMVVGMLRMQKTGCFRRTPPPLRKRMPPSEHLPLLVRFMLRERCSPVRIVEGTRSPAEKEQTPQKAAEEVRKCGEIGESKPTVVAKAERRSQKRRRVRAAEKRDFLPVDWADSGKRVERGVLPAPDERRVKEIVGKDATELLRRIEAALEKGRRALLRMQDRAGFWRYGNRWMGADAATEWDYGSTALALWALLSAGQPRNSTAVVKGFKALRRWRGRATYTAALVLLAIDAYCREKGAFGPRFRTRISRNFKTSPKWLKVLARRAANILIEGQLPDGFWTYYGRLSRLRTQPQKTHPSNKWGRSRRRIRWGDASNTQFAMLGLDAARRLGIHIPKEVFERNLKAMLSAQEQEREGREYRPAFVVPAAEMSIKQLRHQEARAAKGAKTIAQFNRRLWKTVAAGGEAKTMWRRGFGYRATPTRASASMTAAGLVNLIISKAALEECGALRGKRLKKVNQAIRDAAAWIAGSLDRDELRLRCWRRPLSRRHKAESFSYYALLSLERAGVFALVYKFGRNDWYALGAKALLNTQSPGGSWMRGVGMGEQVVSVRTSFALLFLARGVAGLVGTPGIYAAPDADKVIETGKRLFKGR